MKPIKIIIHHSDDTDSFSRNQFDKINYYHKQKWNFKSSLGFYGGYQYLIEKSGEVRQYRQENEEGAHTKGQNIDSIGICLAGNFDIEIPNEKQEESLISLIDKIINRWNIKDFEIYPHRYFGDTACYGKMLSDTWARDLYIGRKISLTKKLLELYRLLLKALKLKK